MQDVEILSWFSESRSRSRFRTKSSTIFQSKIQHLLLTISSIAAQKHFRNYHCCILCFTMSAVETTVQNWLEQRQTSHRRKSGWERKTREARSHHYIDEQSKMLHCSPGYLWLEFLGGFIWKWPAHVYNDLFSHP